MQYALLAALITGVAAPALGTYLVQRRLALIGDGLGHVALTGVGAALLTAGSPVLFAMVAAAAGAVLVELVRQRGRTSGDVALAVMFYGGIAGGVFLTARSPESTTGLTGFLFGSPLTVSAGDLAVMAALGAAVVAVAVGLRPWLFAVGHDEEFARAAGLPVRALNLLTAVATAVTVTVAMRAVGLLLVSALMVVPVATAQLLTRSFRATQHLAMAIGVVAAGTGIWVSGAFDTAPGATIVLLAIAAFAATAVGTAARRRARDRSPGARPVGSPPAAVSR
ncbi:MAG TPA: metal ABC transporter permease [Natronosporangium sp.]|nr:metal ABC transporter permease [Natronosporangium sp.]